MEFVSFPSIKRISRPIVITEKIDGSNGVIAISETGEFFVGSRNRWLSETEDNFGFYKWAMNNKEELMKLGVGRHYGEWWWHGIQVGYNLKERRFSLFNTKRWKDDDIRPSCCSVVPILYEGDFSEKTINDCLENLRTNGSVVSPGFMNPEGIIIYHTHANVFFKKTLKNDEAGKSYGS